uniref:Uncharacterized protein n=1 Tax=Chlamydomonas euryale TaxID=1486919 RepID=A0A7R9VX35_9CHLO
MEKFPAEHIIMEYSPGVPERNLKLKELMSTVKMLQDILHAGYTVVNIEDKDANHNPSLDGTLPPMDQVTLRNLAYDERDVKLISEQKLGCPMPEEWVGRFCGASTPEDLSPRSLRCMFGHNTNLWAARSPGLQTLGGRVGLLDLDDPPDKFFVTRTFRAGNEDHIYGMGWRRCFDMDPQWQVRHRCPCTNKDVCGAEEAMVLAASAAGRISSNYVLPSKHASRRML